MVELLKVGTVAKLKYAHYNASIYVVIHSVRVSESGRERYNVWSETMSVSAIGPENFEVCNDLKVILRVRAHYDEWLKDQNG